MNTENYYERKARLNRARGDKNAISPKRFWAITKASNRLGKAMQDRTNKK